MNQAQAVGRGRVPAVRARVTLKPYIDATPLSVVRQMADFVAGADQRDLVKVMTSLRCPLTEAQLKSRTATRHT